MSTFIYAPTKDKKENCLLYQSNNDHDIFYQECNKNPLAKVYNKAIDFAIQEDIEYLILTHDDVILENLDYEKLKKHFETYDVLGVAGASQITIQEPVLWHLMGGGIGSGNLHGAVAHLHNEKKSMTAFGPYPQQCLIMDGVFLAISRKVFKEVRFDEDCPSGFHMYDIDYTLSASLKGFKCGVIDNYITHASPGLREFTEDWKEGQSWFLEKYKKYKGKVLKV